MRFTISIVTMCLLTILYQGCMTYSQTPQVARPRVTVDPLFSPEVYNRIAVYVVDRTGSLRRSKGILRQVEDEFMRAVIEKGYNLATRSDIEQIAKEQDFQASSFSEQALARKAKALNVSAVLLVSINELSTVKYRPIIYQKGKKYYRTLASISARLIDAERALVVWISSYSSAYQINDKHLKYKAIKPVSRIVASGLPFRYKSH